MKHVSTRRALAALLFVGAAILIVEQQTGAPDEGYGKTGFYIDNIPTATPRTTSFFTDAAVAADGSVIAVGAFFDNNGQADRPLRRRNRLVPITRLSE